MGMKYHLVLGAVSKKVVNVCYFNVVQILQNGKLILIGDTTLVDGEVLECLLFSFSCILLL